MPETNMTSVPGSGVCDPKPAKGAISSAPGILGLIRETLDVLKSYRRGGLAEVHLVQTIAQCGPIGS